MNEHIFDDFVSKEAAAAERQIDWSRRLEEWKSYLSELYEKIEGFVQKYVSEEKMELSYHDKQISELYIGEYHVKSLTIKLGRNQIQFDPVGTNIIGAKGRVDMIGPNGKVRFVVVDKNLSGPRISARVSIRGEEPRSEEERPKVIEWVWKISTLPPAIKYIELEQEAFFDAMMEVVNG